MRSQRPAGKPLPPCHPATLPSRVSPCVIQAVITVDPGCPPMSLLGKPTTSSWRPCSSPSAWRGSTRLSRSSLPGYAHSEYDRTKYSLSSLRSSQNTPACTYNGSTYYYGSTYYGSTYYYGTTYYGRYAPRRTSPSSSCWPWLSTAASTR